MINPNDCVPSGFFAPAHDELPRCSHTRQCPSLSDAAWIELGVSRVIEGSVSGRGFLQNITSQGNKAPSYTHFFETLKSTRRLRLCEELNEHIASSNTHRIPDALAAFRELDDFAIRVGDGHWHSTASHDPRQVSSIREDGTQVL